VTSHCTLAGWERECVPQPSVPGTVIPMTPNTLLLNVALRDGHLEGLRLSAGGLTQARRRLGIKTAPLLGSLAESPSSDLPTARRRYRFRAARRRRFEADLNDGIRSSISETRN
jgi:hypothetical protein